MHHLRGRKERKKCWNMQAKKRKKNLFIIIKFHSKVRFSPRLKAKIKLCAGKHGERQAHKNRAKNVLLDSFQHFYSVEKWKFACEKFPRSLLLKLFLPFFPFSWKKAFLVLLSTVSENWIMFAHNSEPSASRLVSRTEKKWAPFMVSCARRNFPSPTRNFLARHQESGALEG